MSNHKIAFEFNKFSVKLQQVNFWFKKHLKMAEVVSSKETEVHSSKETKVESFKQTKVKSSKETKVDSSKKVEVKSSKETEVALSQNMEDGRRSFVSSIGGGNTLLFGEVYILPNVPKGRRWISKN